MRRRRAWSLIALAAAMGLVGCGSSARPRSAQVATPTTTTTTASTPATTSPGSRPAARSTHGASTRRKPSHGVAPRPRRATGAHSAPPRGQQVARRCPPAAAVSSILGRRVNVIAGAAGGVLGCQYLPVGQAAATTAPLLVQFTDLNNQTGSEAPQQQKPTNPSDVENADAQSCTAMKARVTGAQCTVSSTPWLGPGTFAFSFAARSPSGASVAQCQEVIRDLIGAPLTVAVTARRTAGSRTAPALTTLCRWAGRLAAAVM